MDTLEKKYLWVVRCQPNIGCKIKNVIQEKSNSLRAGLEEQMWVYDKQPLPCNDQSDQALVVQNIVSLKMSLKRQLVKYTYTDYRIINTVIYVGKM